jgi:hypothetical protein
MPPDDIQAMIQIADAVLYSAKKGGKNRVQFEVIGPNMAMAEARRPGDAQLQRPGMSDAG